jgi:hypothetical protein
VFGLRWSHFDAEPLAYGSVIMMTVLAVGLDDPHHDFGDATGLVLGPMIATALAHLFAASLAHVNRTRALPSRHHSGHMIWHSLHFVFLAVPPLVALLVARLTGWWSVESVLDNAIDYAFAVLLVLGGVSGWNAARQRPWWGMLAGIVAAAVIGFVVIIVKLTVEH